MKIAFVHFHLKTGGVTTVIKQQIEAIRNDCDVMTICGEAPPAVFPGAVACVAGLGYDRPEHPPLDPSQVAEAVLAAIKKRWPQGCDLLHVHNPLLAKNRRFLKILKTLQEKGVSLLLQIHDFAEDGRPAVYFKDDYPADCHYAVINSRDYHRLLSAGLQPPGLHFLANSINPLPHESTGDSLSSCVLYPIRAIRRKNVGEAVLISLFLKGDQFLAITLPPHSPSDMPSYRAWQQLVAARHLKVRFELGLRQKYATLVGAARFLITTSINEGFGFSYLEPWSAHKLLWGRNLPEICRDFQDNGVDLNHLYTRMAIPTQWIDGDRLYAQWRAAASEAGRLFDYTIDTHRIEQAWAELTGSDTIDFGLLHETFQQQVISKILTQPNLADELIALNPFLKHPGQIAQRHALIAKNNAAVSTHYTGRGYRDRLLATYAHVIATTVKQHIDKKVLVDAFLDLHRFSLLKWKPYE